MNYCLQRDIGRKRGTRTGRRRRRGRTGGREGGAGAGVGEGRGGRLRGQKEDSVDGRSLLELRNALRSREHDLLRFKRNADIVATSNGTFKHFVASLGSGIKGRKLDPRCRRHRQRQLARGSGTTRNKTACRVMPRWSERCRCYRRDSPEGKGFNSSIVSQWGCRGSLKF